MGGECARVTGSEVETTNFHVNVIRIIFFSNGRKAGSGRTTTMEATIAPTAVATPSSSSARAAEASVVKMFPRTGGGGRTPGQRPRGGGGGERHSLRRHGRRRVAK